ncbi:MAG: hypothetical protein BMS9Abin11_1409 [Gammaproteobacteria bacterium]|nr:MAG: hypothetical protein BMS9Abin11_1409 [Gammaproteobacteria bacterium]
MNKYFCEFLGTFTLIFVGSSAIVINNHTGEVTTHLSCRTIRKEGCCVAQENDA